MIDDVRALLDNYNKWLRDKTQLREIGDWIEVTTPYLDRHNDYLQIYAKRIDGGFLLTDDGYTIQDLEQSGTKLNSAKRQQLLKLALNGFGVQLESDRLEVRASSSNFAVRKHNLVQAMLSVNDMFYLAVPMVASLFYEDVVEWLDLHDIRYTPKVKFTGKSGFDHLFGFVIPKSRQQPERIVEAVNRPNRDTAESIAFKWIDTKDVRPPDAKALVLLNDSDHELPSGVEDALLNYDVRPVPWSRREDVRAELAA